MMDSQPDAPSSVLLAISMWVTWAIPAIQESDATPTPEPDPAITVVTWLRLRELGPRLSAHTAESVPGAHQLVRFNLYNFGERSVRVCGLRLRSARGEALDCALTPSVEVNAGARYPVIVEVRRGPVTEAVEVEVAATGRRFWVRVQTLQLS